MTLRTNTVEFPFTTNLSTVATDTTLGTATRHDFSAITVYIPETVSRTFRSVIVEIGWNDSFTSAATISGWRIGCKLAAVAFSDQDFTSSQITNTGDHDSGIFTADFTTYFTSNFGSGTSQTCQIGVAMSTTAARAWNNISAKLIITYEYDDHDGADWIASTIRTLRIPLHSHHASLTTSQQEVGTTGGTNNAPANQIPILDDWLPTGATIRDAWVEITSSTNSTGTGDFNSFVQFDAATELTRATIEQALTTGVWTKDIIDYDTATYVTSTVHSFSMRSSVTARFNHPTVVLHVSYEFDPDPAVTTEMVHSVLLPLKCDAQAGVLLTTNERYFCDIVVQEGTPELLQSGVMFFLNTFSTTTNFDTLVTSEGQTERTYTTSVGVGPNGGVPILHRVDHGSGFELDSKGVTRFTIDIRASGTVFQAIHGAYLILNYRAAVPSGGPGACAHTTKWHINSATAVLSLRTTATGGENRTPNIPESLYELVGVCVYSYLRCPSTVLYPIGAEVLSGEFDSDGYRHVTHYTWSLELGPRDVVHYFTDLFNSSSFETGKLAIETARSWTRQASTGCVDFTQIWMTYHAITYTVSGTLSRYAGDGSGISVQVYNSDHELVATATTTAGGAFTASVFDNSLEHYICARQDADHVCRSDNGTPA